MSPCALGPSLQDTWSQAQEMDKGLSTPHISLPSLQPSLTPLPWHVGCSQGASALDSSVTVLPTALCTMPCVALVGP